MIVAHGHELPAVAIVEDDVDLRESIQAYLGAKGYRVWSEGSAELFYKHLLSEPVDVVILDIGLPGESGLAVALHLQAMDAIKVIILSGRSSTEDRLRGLSAGADRYLVKPLDLRELEANIDACTRHLSSQQSPVQIDESWRLIQSEWVLVSSCSKKIKLTSHEWQFMNCILQGENQTASRADIATALGGSNFSEFDFHRIDMIVLRMRQKIARITGRTAPIHTLRSYGFTFSVKCHLV